MKMMKLSTIVVMKILSIVLILSFSPIYCQEKESDLSIIRSIFVDDYLKIQERISNKKTLKGIEYWHLQGQLQAYEYCIKTIYDYENRYAIE